MRLVIVNSSTLKVVNVCEWEGHEWLPPFGTFVVQDDIATFGDSYNPITHEFTIVDRTSKDPQ
jgi:hypothetical protein